MQLEAVEVDGMMQAGETNERLEYMQCSMRDRQHCLEMEEEEEEEDLDPEQGSRVGKNSYETYIKSCNTACRVGMGVVYGVTGEGRQIHVMVSVGVINEYDFRFVTQMIYIVCNKDG